ncbi:hypothetical protein BTO20_10120 [Mycobacterium dioxanotrophicus]|uniref:Type I restriction modification DNA specificity domain-containing protein n=1 Tax=Mycobacterium dioxanotrophicus TaxID=482462 RepID=A0A1Y0C194_9MYCO|nr:restriction endonuclease subunit S [Mycobacterium dioxanotrophicus]ART68894.1 hypothetical protein BTO20_10120 [Mycobacterium dioxanotrophicus]
MKWPTLKLGEVAEVRIGPFGSLLHKEDYVADGVPLVNPMHIERGSILPDPRHAVSVEKASQLSNYRLAEGDVVLGRRGEMGRCAVVDATANGYLCGTGSLIVRPGPALSSKFLSLLLSSPDMVRTLERESLGTTMPNLNQEIVSKIQISLPPLDEQRRIAAILDHTDAIRIKQRAAIDCVNQLGHSEFARMFDGIKPQATLGECGDIQGGLQVTKARDSLPLAMPYLRVANVHRGRLDLSEVKLISVTATEQARTRLESGDLLFVEGHANPREVGRVAMWTGEIHDCVHQNHLIRFRPNADRLDPVFAVAWFNSEAGASHFRRAGNTTSGLNTISTSTVRSAPTAIPPIGEQRRFRQFVSRVQQQHQHQLEVLAQIDELFASLQSRAFRGEL